MQIISGGINSLSQIPTRNHYDLQNLNYSDDHLLYLPGGIQHNVSGITFGLDASKPGTIAANNVYIATDTKKVYFTFTANTWSEVNGVITPIGNTQGDILYNDGTGYQRLPAGTSGKTLVTAGAGANPFWGTGTGLIASSTSLPSLTSSSSEQTLFTDTVPAGTLGTSGIVRVRALFKNDLNNSGQANTTYKFYIGSTVISTYSTSFTISNNGYIVFEGFVFANAATNAQKGYSTLASFPNSSSLTGAAEMGLTNNGTATEDSTTNLTIKLTGTASGGFPNDANPGYYYIIEKL